MKPRRIGLLGGTFNPVHNGHLHIAGAVLRRLHLDSVLFIPVGIPPHKENQEIAPAHHRMAMLRLALMGIPAFGSCDFEIKQAGPSFTINTLEALKSDYPKDHLYFIIGMDAFSQIKTWMKPERLLSLCNFVVLARPGYPFGSLPEFGPLLHIDRAALRQLDHGESKAYRFETAARTRMHFLSIPPCEISGTEIRNRVKAGKGTKNRLPQSVMSYIIENKIYNEDNDFEGFKKASSQKK